MLVFLSRTFEKGLSHRNIDRTKTLRKTKREREREICRRKRFYFSKYVPTLNFVNIFIFWLVSNFRVNNLHIEILTSERFKHERMAITLPGLVFKQVKMSLLLSLINKTYWLFLLNFFAGYKKLCSLLLKLLMIKRLKTMTLIFWQTSTRKLVEIHNKTS